MEIVNTITGELIDHTDPDKLMEAYRWMDGAVDSLIATKKQIARAMLNFTDTEHKTRYVTGKTGGAKLTMPGRRFHQHMLQQILSQYPDQSDGVLNTRNTVTVSLRGLDKVERGGGDADFMEFKRKLLAAEVQFDPTPRVELIDGGEE